MHVVEGDQVVLDYGIPVYAEVVGTTSKGYDVVRHVDYAVIRNVPHERITKVD